MIVKKQRIHYYFNIVAFMAKHFIFYEASNGYMVKR